MDTGLENTVVENKETGESTKTDEYMSDYQRESTPKPLVQYKTLHLPANVNTTQVIPTGPVGIVQKRG